MKTNAIVWFATTWFAMAVCAASTTRAQCLDWKPSFGLPGGGVSGGPGGGIAAAAVYDDGSGPALYVGGFIDQAGPVAVSNIAKWNGSSWSSLGSGVTGGLAACTSLLAFDDGSGSALYVGGYFTSAGGVPNTGFIARWNGTSWSSVGGGVFGYVYALAAYDDGSGPALYVGGQISQAAGSMPIHNIAKWNGSTWSDVGGGSNFPVRALEACDVGSGPRLFAGGDFSLIGGVSAQYIAQWNGANWSALAGTINSVPYALRAFDDGTGNALFVAGSISNAGGVPVNAIAKWNGSTWSALGSGLAPLSPYSAVEALSVFDDGSGPALYAGGQFTTAGGQSANHIAKWNGSTWSVLGSGASGSVEALAAFDSGDGARLYVGGDFGVAGGLSCSNIASWASGNWRVLDSTPRYGIEGVVNALALFDDGNGSAVYAAGSFAAAGPTIANNIARWNGTGWSALGSGLNVTVRALCVFDDGSGPALCAAGDFTLAGGQPAARVAKWNGSTWAPFGAGLSASVYSLGVFDSGSGPQLYAGGDFTLSGATSAVRIAKWNGSTWSSVGGGTPDRVESMTVFNDGTGPALYAAGQFSAIGGNTILHIARWNGSTWSPVGGGLGYVGSSEDVNALLAFDDGSGLALVAAGSFGYAGGAPAYGAAKWNGSSWTPLGVWPNQILGTGEALAAFDDGSGPALYAGAEIGSVSGVNKWNGTDWTQVGGGLHGAPYAEVNALVVFDDGTSGGPDLFAGGDFSRADTVPSNAIAEWRGCAGPGTLYCFGDTVACPCGNRGIDGHGCDNSAATGGALLASAGHTNPDTVVLAVTHELPSVLSIFLQGNATIAPTAFGDGLRCAGGSLKRLYVHNASGGVVFAPQPGDPSITTRSAQLGDTIVPGSLRYYQTYYRDPSATFCPAPTGNTWNVTNGVRIQW